VNKKVDGQRKRKPEKKHKGDSRHRKSRNGKVKGQKEKRKRDELPGGIITGVKLGIKEKRQEKGEDNKKTCRTRNERKQGRIYAHGRGLQRENNRKRSKKLARVERVGKENPKTKWKMQRRGD
jgi:hypothetical protein